MKLFLVSIKPLSLAIALTNKDMKALTEGMPKVIQSKETGFPANVVISNAESETEMKQQIEYLLNQPEWSA